MLEAAAPVSVKRKSGRLMIYIDRSGETSSYSLIRRHADEIGRGGDLRVLNFTGRPIVSQGAAGGEIVCSNSFNPLAGGDADALAEMIMALQRNGDGDSFCMWRNRLRVLLGAVLELLIFRRDTAGSALGLAVLRDSLLMGKAVDASLLGGSVPGSVEDVPEVAWEELRSRTGAIGIFLKALKGELPEGRAAILSNYMNALPGFSVEAALRGAEQSEKAQEVHSFIILPCVAKLNVLLDRYERVFNDRAVPVAAGDIQSGRVILLVLLPGQEVELEERRMIERLLMRALGNPPLSDLNGLLFHPSIPSLRKLGEAHV